MTAFNRCVAVFAALMLLAMGLTACGDSEPDQRKAFIGFLQQMNNRTGVHVVIPTADDEKAFGDYTKHYAVILSFNQDMGVISRRFNELITKLGISGSPRTIEQMVAHRDDVAAVIDLLAKMQPDIDKRLAQANAERGALKQPDDLKAVYDVTYGRVVTAPAQAIQTSNQMLYEGTKVSLQLADYINSHRGKVTVKGSQILANDKTTLAEVGVILKAHQEAAKRFQDAQRDGEKLLEGR